MNAADIMNCSLITVKPRTTIQDAVGLMVAHGVSGLPVVDDNGCLRGIITEADILHRVEIGTEKQRSSIERFFTSTAKLSTEYVKSHAFLVEEAMTEDVFVVAPQSSLRDVVTLMEEHKIKRLPVVEDGRLLGMISRMDLLKAFLQAAPKTTDEPATDEAIRARIVEEISRQSWAPAYGTSILVCDGIVHLCGTITTDEMRVALRTLAERIPGVKDVKDHLMFIEPLSGIALDPPDGPHLDSLPP